MPTQPPGKIPQKKSRASMPAAERAVTFQLKAPEAKNVLLAGDFTNWRLAERPLRRSADGVWRTTIRLKPGRYEYKFIVDDQWQNDPANENVAPNGLGTVNNVCEVKG